MDRYFVYILISRVDNSFYIGQTSDLDKRLVRHNSGSEKFTRKKVPWQILWHTQVETRTLALKMERKIKNMKSRKRIIEFIKSNGILDTKALSGV